MRTIQTLAAGMAALLTVVLFQWIGTLPHSATVVAVTALVATGSLTAYGMRRASNAKFIAVMIVALAAAFVIVVLAEAFFALPSWPAWLVGTAMVLTWFSVRAPRRRVYAYVPEAPRPRMYAGLIYETASEHAIYSIPRKLRGKERGWR